MTLSNKLKTAAMPLAKNSIVSDVRIGLGYTAVHLNDGRLGLAYTFHGDLERGCDVFKGERPLTGKPAAHLLNLLGSDDRIESAVGLATCNALTNTKSPDSFKGDILEHMDLNPGDSVGMVGNFKPLVPMIRKKCSSLFIFEQIEEPEENFLPEKEALTTLPRCQVAIITSTSIINNTVDAVLSAAQGCRQIIMLGASTPLLASAFSQFPSTLLSGVVVNDPEAVKCIVSEGGGMRSFKNSVTKINLWSA